jgi:hypothetical protein
VTAPGPISRDDATPPVESLKPGSLRILADRMLRIQGYTDPERVRRPIRKAAEKTAATVEQLVEPAVHFRRVAVESCDAGGLRLAGGITLHCDAFPRFLLESTDVVVFALTAGARIDEELARLNDAEDLLEMLFVETAGWLAVEEVTKAFAAHLRAAAKGEGLKITRRMGPGYSYPTKKGDAEWLLDEQRFLFELLDDGNMPVTMLESCAMLPKMSRSGLFGLVPNRTH